MARKKGKRSSWIVRLRCVVIRDVVCEDCTKEEALDDPLASVNDDADEIELVDWEVLSVDENV